MIAGKGRLTRSRITCAVANLSHESVTGAAVEVAGNRALLGTLNAGESRTITLSPRDQAGGVHLTFTLPDGTTKRAVLCGYVESENFGGEIDVEIGVDGKVQVISNSIGPRYFP
jgi:hypothetical protein